MTNLMAFNQISDPTNLHICSKKLKKMPNITSIAAQKTDENKSMAIIVPAVNAPYNMRALTNQKKDFDLIPEPLGE